MAGIKTPAKTKASAKTKRAKVTKPMTPPKPNKTIRYFSISPVKLFLLCFLTFGLYDMYWLYRNWKAVRDDGKEMLSPFLRAVFSIFFINGLFRRIKASASAKNYSKSYNPNALAALFILSSLAEYVLAKVNDGAVAQGLSVSLALGLGIIALIISRTYALVAAQKAINYYLSDTKRYALPSQTGPGATLIVLLGFIYFCLVMIGLFAPADMTNASITKRSSSTTSHTLEVKRPNGTRHTISSQNPTPSSTSSTTL